MSHALLSPSSSHRWLVCTPSARLADLYEETTSAAAEEGTLAHAVCEAMLTNKELPEGATEEMKEYAEGYVAYVNEHRDKNSVLLVEQRADITKYAPESFGTVDCVISNGRELHIIDYKYGKGVRVEAEGNTQMRMYALGILNTLEGLIALPEVVCMHIFQPRIEGAITSCEMTREELEEWGEEYLKPKAREAFLGGADNFEAGEHCRFCPCRGECRALWLHNYGTALRARDIALLNDEELGEVLDKIPEFEIAIKSVQEFALKRVQDGGEIPHYKIVEGRSIRKWKDEKATIQYLQEHGYEDYLDTKLKGIPAIEKLVNDKKEIADLWEKPQGKPTLARDKDVRSNYTLFNFG